jgi:hypothetical protein
MARVGAKLRRLCGERCSEETQDECAARPLHDDPAAAGDRATTIVK